MPAFGTSRQCDRPGCNVVLFRSAGSDFPCGHRICKNCSSETEDFFPDKTRTEQATNKVLDRADCPVCQQKILLPRERLKDVPILRQFRIVMEIFDALGPWYCDECSKSDLPVGAELRCSDCTKNLCEECEKTHLPAGSLSREHRIIKKEEFIKGKDWGEVALVRNNQAMKVKCLQHPEKVLLYLCNECKKLNCEACLHSCSCKRCKKRIRACDVIDEVKEIIDGIAIQLNNSVQWAEDDLVAVSNKKDQTVKEIKMLKSKVQDEIYKRHWVNKQLTFEEDKPPDDQLELIDNHIADIETRCLLTERKLTYDSNGKRLLKQTITMMRLIDSRSQSEYSVILLAFLQFNSDVREMCYRDDFNTTIEFVTKTKCMYHQNCCDDIEAYPVSVQTGGVQIKTKKVCIKKLNTRVEKDNKQPYIGGLTVLETSSNVIISDNRNKALKCFTATEIQRSPVQLPHYEYHLDWRSPGGCGREIENPGVVYTTNTNKLLGLVDNNAVFEYEPKRGNVKSVKMSPNIIGDATHNNAHERLSAKVMYQTHKMNAYLSTSIMSDALQCGVVLPQFLANLSVTPWFYFTTKNEREGHVMVSIVISGFEKIDDLEENKRAVVLFLYNGLLMRTVYMPSREPAGISYNTSDNCAYIADYTYNRVVAFTEKGKFVKVHLDKDDEIDKPIGIVFDVQGRLLVAQEDGNVKIFQRDDEVVVEGRPAVKPPTYKYFVPAVSSLPPDTEDEPDFNNITF
ncbi:uncharacterized protein LOC135497154 [Lineus longissimus]|uniref:uncharacterized protein LOC135497154 n=1 Tax=Lineus longissimus TaxID=88925 RepID=UPI00315D108F